MILTPEQFEDLTRPLIGLPVSLPWNGYGSAVFFELGDLSPRESKRAHHNKGAACISVEWDWRVEAGSAVLYGSSNSRPRIDAGIQALQGETIHSIAVVGQVPELAVRFSNGHCLKSMVMVTGDPEWSIKALDGQWIYVRDGKLQNGDGTSAASANEEAAFALAERASIRWGIPASEPVAGQCAACVSFVRLDGDGHLLDYGCCDAEASPFDGRAVERTSGCPAFTSNAEI
jgi:hypothetical protein